MTQQPGAQGWRSATRELAVATGLVVALTATAWVLLGAVTASIVALVCIALGLVALRTLIDPRSRGEDDPAFDLDAPVQSFAGFWRTQFELNASMRSLSAWDMNTRRRLQNLLAARLSERHGISLLEQPEAAMRAFTGPSRNADLWYWIDPQRPTPADASSRPGIPLRTLAALIRRLEQL